MNKNSSILTLGSRGLVGSAIVRELKKLNYTNILTPLRAELDLLKQQSVLNYFQEHKPQHVFLAAAKVTSREFSYHYQDYIYMASFSQSGAQVSGTGAL